MPLAAVKNKFPLLSQMACDSSLKRLQLAPNEVFVGLPFRKVGPFIRSQDDSSFYSLFCHYFVKANGKFLVDSIYVPFPT